MTAPWYANSLANWYLYGNAHTGYGQPYQMAGWQTTLQGLRELYDLYHDEDLQRNLGYAKDFYKSVYPDKPYIGPARVLPAGIVPEKSYLSKLKDRWDTGGGNPRNNPIRSKTAVTWKGKSSPNGKAHQKDYKQKLESDFPVLVEDDSGKVVPMAASTYGHDADDLVNMQVSHVRVGEGQVVKDYLKDLSMIGRRPVIGDDGEGAVLIRLPSGNHVWQVGNLRYPVRYMGKKICPFSFSSGRYASSIPLVHVV